MPLVQSKASETERFKIYFVKEVHGNRKKRELLQSSSISIVDQLQEGPLYSKTPLSSHLPSEYLCVFPHLSRLTVIGSKNGLLFSFSYVALLCFWSRERRTIVSCSLFIVETSLVQGTQDYCFLVNIGKLLRFCYFD